jgi:acyl-CoA thioester hydrolase
MRKQKAYNHFKTEPGDPQPLVAETRRRVRFEEVDPLRIVWHGRYPGYLEDGRAAFGEKFGLGYDDMYREQFMAPIVQMHIEYHQPLQFPEDFTIITRMHWTNAVKMNFSYQLTKADNIVVATAYTVQILTDLERNFLLVRPPYVEEFCRKWEQGLLK